MKVVGEGRTVRLAFANLLETNLATDRVISWLERDRPDVFICAEAHRHWRRALTALEQDYPHVAGSPQGDVMIFSRRPFEAEPVDLFVDIGHAVAVRVDGLTILGLHTASPEDLRRSTALQDLLDKAGCNVRYHDPFVPELHAGHGVEPPKGAPSRSIELSEDWVKNADAVVILTEWNQFRSLDLDRLRTLLRRPLMVDLRNVYEPNKMREAGFEPAGSTPEQFTELMKADMAKWSKLIREAGIKGE